MKRRCSLVVESHASDLVARVRFSVPAPITNLFELLNSRYEINRKTIKLLVTIYIKMTYLLMTDIKVQIILLSKNCNICLTKLHH